MKIAIFTTTLICLFVSTALAGESQWKSVSGAENLQNFMGGAKAERELPDGEISRGEYSPDGTGMLYSWGASIPRTWAVKGDDQVCITEESGESLCYRFEISADTPGLYRARNVATGETAQFHMKEGTAVVSEKSVKMDDEGGPATPSASELAAELSNPNTAVATLNFKNQFRSYTGTLPGADDQSGYTLVIQPVLPFVLKNGDKIIFRPAIPVLVDQPVLGADGFSGKSGIGDISFDLVYAPKSDGGNLFAYGMIASMPTASDGLGSKRWTMGPEVLIGKATARNVTGMLASHQWDIAGSGNADISQTSAQFFYTHLPGNGWSIGSSPTIGYDWTAEQWTVPLNLTVGKTVVMNGRPWKFSVEVNYYVEKPDAFAPDWMVSLNVAPVVKNGLASWFGL
ncbi:MAG: hypothetical protein PVJ14_07645 [Chromatiales bacterium]|jgi:hypothetical protein